MQKLVSIDEGNLKIRPEENFYESVKSSLYRWNEDQKEDVIDDQKEVVIGDQKGGSIEVLKGMTLSLTI